MKSILLLLSLLGLFASCNSAPTGSDALLRVTMRRYKQGQVFELVSETHTNAKEYYSTLRKDANRKVLPDRSMQSLVDGIRQAGMSEYGQDGPAPTSAVGGIASSFEIQQGEAVTSWAPRPGSTEAARKEQQAFFFLLNDFLKIYSQTESFQFVTNKKGGEIFQEAKLKTQR